MADDDDLGGFGFGFDDGVGGDEAPTAAAATAAAATANVPAPVAVDDDDEFDGDADGFGFEAADFADDAVGEAVATPPTAPKTSKSPPSPTPVAIASRSSSSSAPAAASAKTRAADPPQPEQVDYNAADYFDPNLPPPRPPPPRLPKPGSVDQQAVTEDSLYVSWPRQIAGLKSLVLQGRKCKVNKSQEVIPCDWEAFDAFNNKDDVQVVIRDKVKRNTGGRVFGLKPATPYMFRLIATNRVGKVIGKVSQPIWTCEPERGSLSGWLQLDKGTGSGTLRKMSFRKKRVFEQVWVVLLGESLHIQNGVDGKTKRVIPMKSLRSIDSEDSSDQGSRHFRMLTTEGESIVFFARTNEICAKWLQTLRQTLSLAQVEFGSSAKTNLMF